MPNSTASGHLEATEFYDLLEDQLTRARKREVEAHLEECGECVEALAMIVRAERPATREEQAELAAMAEPSAEEVSAGLRAEISRSGGGTRGGAASWKPLLAAAVVFLSVAGGSWLFYTRSWLPASSRRIAAETLAAMVELRQATGRIPLRYLHELERASVTRSGFDAQDPAERALMDNLRSAVERSPTPEAMLALGLLLLDDGELDEAESWLGRVLELDPASADALNGLAVVHYARAERDPDRSYELLQRGLGLLRKAQAAAPEDLRVLYNFGKFYEALEMHPAAIQAWTRYLQTDPHSQWAEEAAYQLAQLTPP